jgi:phage gpG-like protein
MADINKTPDFLAMGEELKKNLVADLEKEGMDFIHANFKDEGFIDTSFEAWPERKQASDFGLLRVTNTLFNSISSESSGMSVTFTADAPHAEMHNEGGTFTVHPLVTEKSRKFFWAMYKKTGVGMWKGMALTKKERLTITMKIPKRQFMGDSAHFHANFEAHILGEIQRTFQRLSNVK